MIKIALISFLLIFSSCAIPSFLQIQEDIELTKEQTTIFADLLNQGWNIELYESQIILIKHTKNGLLVNDIFNILEK